MARTAGEAEVGAAPGGVRDKVAAGSVIGAHTLQHTYQHGFYVIVPELYTALGLTPVAAGALEMVRRFSGGVASLGGGFLLDRFQDRRILVLYLSLIAMGLGYLLVGVVPVYVVILAAAGLASAAGSIWHPAALRLLSKRYPARRGLMIALHRSAGSVGDFAGPLLVGGLLVVLMWRGVLYGALPLALLFALPLWLVLRRVPGWQATPSTRPDHGSVAQQLRAIASLLRVRSLLMLGMNYAATVPSVEGSDERFELLGVRINGATFDRVLRRVLDAPERPVGREPLTHDAPERRV